MKLFIVILAVAALAPAAYAARQGDFTSGEAKCAAEDMQLLYYYLAPDMSPAAKPRATSCHSSMESVSIPDWLKKERPELLKKKVWKDPYEGGLTAADLWQTPASILYQFARTTLKTLPADEGGAGTPPSELEGEYNDMRMRFLLSEERLAKAGLTGSLDGRGGPLLSELNRGMKLFDAVAGALSARDDAAFYRAAARMLDLSRGVFDMMFRSPPNAGEWNFRYTPEPMVLPGYRGVSVPVDASQALFLHKGDHVDMLVTFEALMGNGGKEKITATILQNVTVLNVHKPDGPSGAGVVQLLCNPMEAEYAALSAAQGAELDFSRRAPGDDALRPMEVASFKKLVK